MRKGKGAQSARQQQLNTFIVGDEGMQIVGDEATQAAEEKRRIMNAQTRSHCSIGPRRIGATFPEEGVTARHINPTSLKINIFWPRSLRIWDSIQTYMYICIYVYIYILFSYSLFKENEYNV